MGENNFFSLLINANKEFFLDSDVTAIPSDDIKLLVSSAQLAPYLGPQQGIHLMVVNDRDIIKKLAAYTAPFVKNSALVIISLANVNVPVSMVNSLLASNQIYLMGLSMNKAVKLIDSFEETPIKKILDWPDVYKMTNMLAIGSMSDKRPVPRKTERLSYLASINTFGKKLTDILDD